LAFVDFVGCNQANQDLKQDLYAWLDFLGLCLPKKRVGKSKFGITSQVKTHLVALFSILKTIKTLHRFIIGFHQQNITQTTQYI
jgi:hypothetical protein